MAVGVGRAVVKNETATIAWSLPQQTVEIHGLPAFQEFRLLLRQAGLHGKVGLREEESLPIVAAGRGGWLVIHRQVRAFLKSGGF
jgi:hypothetical protein